MDYRLMRRRRRWPVALLLGAGMIISRAARAQQVVVIVNGEPITALDIEQRSKLNQLSTHKVPSREEVLQELSTEILKVKEGKRWGFELSSTEVDGAFANMASRMRITPDQLTQMLARSGVNPTTLKQRIKADMTWPQLVRGRFQSSLQVAEKALLRPSLRRGGAMRNRCGDDLKDARKALPSPAL